MLPGPEAHELCVHLGMMRGGRIGGILAGLGFMLPGLILILALAWLYARIDLSQQPLAAMFLGVQVGVIAIIVRAVHRIGEHVLTDRWLWLVTILAALASALNVQFWLSLPHAGLVYSLLAGGRAKSGAAVLAIGAVLAMLASELRPDSARAAGEAAVASAGALALFLSGLKAGLFTFGGAYTAIPFVRHDEFA